MLKGKDETFSIDITKAQKLWRIKKRYRLRPEFRHHEKQDLHSLFLVEEVKTGTQFRTRVFRNAEMRFPYLDSEKF